jgi:hypothetical protein
MGRRLPNVLLGGSTFVHPSVSIGPGCIIESGVVLGHPGADDIHSHRFLAANADTTDDFYRNVRTVPYRTVPYRTVPYRRLSAPTQSSDPALLSTLALG